MGIMFHLARLPAGKKGDVISECYSSPFTVVHQPKRFPDPINNVWAYDEEHPSNPPLKNILNPQKETLSELRGLTLANGYLYVVNGSKDQSDVLCFSSDLQGSLSYTFQSLFISSSLAIDHPFSCTYRLVSDPDLPNSMYQS